jgi:hypothetical protein
LKKKKKEMEIQDRLRSAQELKNLEEELKNVQAEKQLSQAKLEPLQEGAKKMLKVVDAAKGNIENLRMEAKEILKEHIIV